MAGIFISYRREDTQGWVGNIAHALKKSFPGVQIFHDITTIQPGEDFQLAIDRALSTCQIMLALIGPRWLSAQNLKGLKRIDERKDFVRYEISQALARGILVVPVLLGGAAMPGTANLPNALRLLARKQGYELSDTRWEYDCRQLFLALGDELGIPPLGIDQAVNRPSTNISVAEGMKIKGNTKIKDIAGIKASDNTKITLPDCIEVVKNAKIEGDADIGDIAAVKIEKKDS